MYNHFLNTYVLFLYCIDSFDVYISEGFRGISLIDINPLTETNSTCLFKFNELKEHSANHHNNVLFRCIEKSEDCIIGAYERNFLPVDLLNAVSGINDIDFNNFIR